MKKKIAVIGGGAAGMFAALNAAERGCEVHLFEKNEKLGKKIYITGKGRCNLTNACDTEELFQAVVSNPKFLYSAFYGYTNHDVIDFFEKAGTKTKIERGDRVFPAFFLAAFLRLPPSSFCSIKSFINRASCFAAYT